MLLAFSCTYCLFHISYIDTCWHQTPLHSMLRFHPFLIHENQFSFGFGLCLCRFHHESFVQHCSCLCQLIRFLAAPSVTNFVSCDIPFLSFFVRCALTCSTSTHISFDVNRCNSSQILIHTVFRSMHFLSPLRSAGLLCLHPPYIPCKGVNFHHDPIAPLTNHMLSTFQRHPEESRQWQRGL